MNHKLSRWGMVVGCVAVLFGSLLLGTASHAQSNTPVPTMAATDSGDVSYSLDDVKHSISLDELRGYIQASLAVWKSGDYTLASTQASRAVAQFATLADVLKAKNADTALKAALDAYIALAGQGGDDAKVTAASKAVLDAADAAEQALVGPNMTDTQFQGEVIAGLISNVETEYTESFKDGKIYIPADYQDAMSTFLLAQARWATVSAGLESDDFTKVQTQFDTLKKDFPDYVKFPDQPATTDDIEKTVDDLTDGLEDVLDLPQRTNTEPVDAILDKVHAGVEEALADYKAGKADDAYEAAVSAYLDNFEGLESAVLQKDKDLVPTIETEFKALRDGIQAGKPQADLEAIAQTIYGNLDKVEKLLE